ncbi:MAG: hypothetical protein ACOYMW_16260 [Candidatus Competibacteraceae bacterium]
MIFDLSLTVRTARAQVIANALDGGSGKAKWLFYTGPKPVAGAAITTETLLATVLLTDPCGSVTDGALTLTSDGDVLAVADGVIAWSRFTDSADTYVMDADVTNTAGSGAIKIDNTQVYTGGTIRVVSATFTEA